MNSHREQETLTIRDLRAEIERLHTIIERMVIESTKAENELKLAQLALTHLSQEVQLELAHAKRVELAALALLSDDK